MTVVISPGKQIKIMRIIRGFKQGELADVIGVRQPTLSDFEHDKLNPSKKRMKAIKAMLRWPEQAEVAFEILAGDGDAVTDLRDALENLTEAHALLLRRDGGDPEESLLIKQARAALAGARGGQ